MKNKVKKEAVIERKKTQEDVARDSLEKVKVKDGEKEKDGFDFMGLLENPNISALLKSGKEIFKKKETDPNVCEISIKAPSEVVLKLFKVSEEK